MVNCSLCSSLRRKEEKEAKSGPWGGLVRKYAAESTVQACARVTCVHGSDV